MPTVFAAGSKELDQFFGQHGIYICLLIETHLRSGEVFRLANYVFHRNDQITKGGGTAILVRRDIDYHAVPVQDLQHLEATAIQVMLTCKPVKILAVYLSPTRPLIASDLSACLGSGFPVLVAGDMNAKHVEWNSRLTTKIGRLLRDYADKNSCLIYGPSTPTTVPYSPSATPDVLEIVITIDLVCPVYLTTCSELSSDHLTILIDTHCRSSFLSPPDRPNLRTDWPKFRGFLEAGQPYNRDLDAYVKELSSAISKALKDSAPKCRSRGDPQPPQAADIQDEIRQKSRLRRR
jgi:hypothetical protein